MYDMTPFERQLSGEISGLMGPIRPVDDLALLEVAASRLRRWGFTMSSAVKFIAAGVIVALFGGFLLAGVLTAPQGDEAAPAAVTESPSPMTSKELLSGMVTEEVEPGVFRVIHDGHRDIVLVDGWADIVAANDGSVWLSRWAGINRLGSPESIGHPVTGDYLWLDVASDGTVWMARGEGDGLFSLEEGSWTRQDVGRDAESLTMDSDGTLWSASGGAARLGVDGWEQVAGPSPVRLGDLTITRSGEVWKNGGLGHVLWPGAGYESDLWKLDGLWRYREDEDEWQEVAVDAVVYHPCANAVEVGSDGTVWFAGTEPLMVDGRYVPNEGRTGALPGDSFLMRFDGTEWQRWEPADGVPPLGWDVVVEQAPDGGLWMTAPFQLTADGEVPCSERWGVARFDGSHWQHFLSGHCVTAMDVASDGSVWLLADGSDGFGDPGLCVITPEAVAATE